MSRAVRILTSCLVLMCLLRGSYLAAQTTTREGFEGPDTSWKFASSDARYVVQLHQRVQNGAHGGNWCEHVRLVAGNGSFIHLMQDIGKAAVIEELQPSVWVRANRANLQLMARVVLPRSLNPRTGQPITTYLSGSVYRNAGNWEQLRLSEIPKLLARETRLLRAQLGPQVDSGEAYLDQLVLNCYAGQGVSEVFVDDLEIQGLVGPLPLGDAGDLRWMPGGQGAEAKPRPEVVRTGSLLQVAGRPFFTRAIEYQGEPLELLQRMGFNAVALKQPPGLELATRAAQLGLWIISPPPGFSAAPTAAIPAGGSSPSTGAIDAHLDWVLAWDMGDALSNQQLEHVRSAISSVRRADPLERPIICDAASDVRAYSRHVDFLRPTRFPLGSTLDLGDYGTWLRDRPLLARPGTPIWTTIQTGPSPAARDQVLAMAAAIIPDRPITEAMVHSEQIRLVTFTALAAGVRGLVFASHERLDAPSQSAQMRAASLELLNLELQLIEPWLAAGSLVAAVPGNRKDVFAAVLETDRATLMLPIWLGKDAQYAAGQSAGNRLSFVVPGVAESDDAFEVSPGTMRRLTHQRVTGGLRVTLDEFGLTSMVLITNDPLVISSLSNRLKHVSARASQLEQALAAHRLQVIEQLDLRLSSTPHGIPQSGQWIQAAKANLAESRKAAQAGAVATTYLEARRARRPLRMLERAHWETAVEEVPSPVTWPLLTHPSLLAHHWELLPRMRTAQLEPNRLAGGDCDQLERMLQAGWRHFQHAQPDAVVTAAELSSASVHGGGYALRLRATPTEAEDQPSLIESPPVWVTSAPVAVRRGEVFRIHGWVRVPAPILGSVDGLMIIDSLGGSDLALRIGATTAWEEFTLFRAAPQDGQLALTFALTGLGEAWIDDITVEQVVLQRASSNTFPGSSARNSNAGAIFPNAGAPAGTAPRR